MKIPNLSGIVSVGKSFVVANRPELLLGASVVGTISAVVLAARGGYQARGIIEEERQRLLTQSDYKGDDLTTKEKVQLTWLCYMPAAITTVGALTSTTGLHIVHVKDKKALAASALMALDQAKQETEKALDEVWKAASPEQRKDIQEKIYENNAHPETGVAVMQNSDGEVEEMYLVRDAWSGRDIWSNRRRIEDAVNEFNNVMNGQDYSCELNTFYTYAGFAELPEGNEIGFSGALMAISWDTTVRDDGRPVSVFTFRTKPEKGFDNKHR